MSNLFFSFLILCFVSCQQSASKTGSQSLAQIDSSLIGLRLDSAIARLGQRQGQIFFADEPPRIFSRAVFLNSDSVETTFFFERTALIDPIDSAKQSAILFSKKVIRIEQANLRTGATMKVGGRLQVAVGEQGLLRWSSVL